MHVGTQNGTFVTFERFLGVRLVIQIDHRHLKVSMRERAATVNDFREMIGANLVPMKRHEWDKHKADTGCVK